MSLRRLGAPAPFEAWRVELDALPTPAALTTLSASEHARAARFVFDRDRRRYLAAHVALRDVLAQRTGRASEALVYVEGPNGKPSIADTPRCAFNLSHSEDVALIALADDGLEIGVDVEVLRTMSDARALAKQNFSATENAELAATPVADESLAFLYGWTRKEACLKAIGSGLSIAPNTFTAGLAPTPARTTIATPDGTAEVEVMSFRDGADVMGSLARVVAWHR